MCLNQCHDLFRIPLHKNRWIHILSLRQFLTSEKLQSTIVGFNIIRDFHFIPKGKWSNLSFLPKKQRFLPLNCSRQQIGHPYSYLALVGHDIYPHIPKLSPLPFQTPYSTCYNFQWHWEIGVQEKPAWCWCMTAIKEVAISPHQPFSCHHLADRARKTTEVRLTFQSFNVVKKQTAREEVGSVFAQCRSICWRNAI